MTKLLEWLFGGFLFIGIWSALLLNPMQYNFTETQSIFIFILPVIAIGIFGIYAVTVVLWRVYTFNNCESAATELQKQIKEAKADLKSKGFQFEELM